MQSSALDSLVGVCTSLLAWTVFINFIQINCDRIICARFVHCIQIDRDGISAVLTCVQGGRNHVLVRLLSIVLCTLCTICDEIKRTCVRGRANGDVATYRHFVRALSNQLDNVIDVDRLFLK